MYAAPSRAGGVSMTITAMMRGISRGTPISDWHPASGGGGDDGLASEDDGLTSEAGRKQSGGAGAGAATVKAEQAAPCGKRAYKRGRTSEGVEAVTRGERARKRGRRSGQPPPREREEQRSGTTYWYSAIVKKLDGKAAHSGDFRRRVMTAPSGAGKTQALYDIAARRHCVLLVLATADRAGVDDLEAALATFSSKPRTNSVSNTDWLSRTLHGAVVEQLYTIAWLTVNGVRDPMQTMMAQLHPPQWLAKALCKLSCELRSFHVDSLISLRDTLLQELRSSATGARRLSGLTKHRLCDDWKNCKARSSRSRGLLTPVCRPVTKEPQT